MLTLSSAFVLLPHLQCSRNAKLQGSAFRVWCFVVRVTPAPESQANPGFERSDHSTKHTGTPRPERRIHVIR